MTIKWYGGRKKELFLNDKFYTASAIADDKKIRYIDDIRNWKIYKLKFPKNLQSKSHTANVASLEHDR